MLGVDLDVTSPESIDAAFGRVESELGAVELLVLNAGVYIVEPFEETSLESWRKTIDVNLTGAFLCARRALPAMREAGFGRLVSIGSSAGKTGGKRHAAAYGASKAGIMVMTKSIASEYAEHGITANALAPALIDTDMIADLPDLTGRSRSAGSAGPRRWRAWSPTSARRPRATSPGRSSTSTAAS